MIGIKILIFSLIGTIVFGMVDAGFFLVLEEKLSKKINNSSKNLDVNSTGLIVGGLSSAVSIFIYGCINMLLKRFDFEIEENPILDVIGIVIGTILIVLFYHFDFIDKIKADVTNK